MKSSISKRQLREFGFLIGFGFPILIGWILPAIGGHLFRTWTLLVGITSLLLGILRPFSLYYPCKAWIAIGHALGWINSRVILGLVFLMVLQPIALIMGLVGHDPLRKKQGNQKSYRESNENHKIDLTRIF